MDDRLRYSRRMPPRKGPSAPLAAGTIAVSPLHDGAYVYRAYCRCGDLLYVGIAYDLFGRLAGHRRGKSPWEHKLARLDWEFYPTRRDALRVEANAIRIERPLFNKHHALPGGRPVSLPWPRSLSDAELDRCAIAAYRGRTYLEWVFSGDGVAA